MADRNSQFTVDRLTPERIGGGTNASYALTGASVNPTMIVGSDDAGMPVEETVPAVYSRMFVGLDGCIRNDPMRTSAVFSMEPEAERYEIVRTKENIQAGVFPLEVCPYTTEFAHIRRGPLVKIPEGEEACGGSNKLIRDGSGQISSGGCEHMQKLIATRKALSRAKHDKLQESSKTMKSEDVEKLMESTAKAFGVALQAANPDAAKARLRSGQGEK